jgi:hypothetical protein
LGAGDVYRFRYSVGDTLNDARESTFVTANGGYVCVYKC